MCVFIVELREQSKFCRIINNTIKIYMERNKESADDKILALQNRIGKRNQDEEKNLIALPVNYGELITEASKTKYTTTDYKEYLRRSFLSLEKTNLDNVEYFVGESNNEYDDANPNGWFPPVKKNGFSKEQYLALEMQRLSALYLGDEKFRQNWIQKQFHNLRDLLTRS